MRKHPWKYGALFGTGIGLLQLIGGLHRWGNGVATGLVFGALLGAVVKIGNRRLKNKGDNTSPAERA
jgi:hypothetical protein